MKVARTKGPENAAIVERALKYKSELGNIENLEAQKQSAEILSPTSEFDYLPDRTQDIKNIEQRILDQKAEEENQRMLAEYEAAEAEEKRQKYMQYGLIILLIGGLIAFIFFTNFLAIFFHNSFW